MATEVLPEDCSTPAFHATHYYCPSCSFVSEDAATDVIATPCECHDAVTSIRQDLDNLLTIVKAIHEEVGPTLDALKNNPMLKMFFK